MVIGLVLDDTLDKSDGVQQAVLAIGTELTSRNHEVHYIVMDTVRNDMDNIHSMGKYVSLGFNGNSVRTPLPVSSKKIKKLFDKIEFDILHVQMPYSPLFASKVLKFAPKKTKKFGTFHILPYNDFSYNSTKVLGRLLRKSLKSLDGIFAVSEPSLEFMKFAFNVKGSVLPNPVDYNYYNSFSKVSSEKINITFVGRFDQRKGVKELVTAYSELDDKIRNLTTLTMVGRGPLSKEIAKISKKNDLNIKLPGFVSQDQKAQYLANADIAVFPSKSGESFGIVLTEAMSAGSGVVIGGNNPGYSSVLSEWPETLFDPRDTTEFKNLLESMILNHNNRNVIGKKQHTNAKQYDIKNIVDKLEHIYKEHL